MLPSLLRSTRSSSKVVKRSISTSAEKLRAYPKAEVSSLANGLRIASECNRGSSDTATVGVWIDAGSRYETPENNGVAHFLEHISFKGTGKRTQQKLEQEVEDMGGHLNAYTSREQTVFYANVHKEKVPQAMDIIADILNNSNYSEESINWERGVILREMQEVEGNMEEMVFDRLHETAYRGCMLGKTILGPETNINSISKQQIEEYVNTHYVAPRMVVAAAGNVNHGELVNLSEKLFGGVPTTGKKAPHAEPALFTGSDIRIRYDDMPEAHIALGFPTGGWTDPDSFPLMILQSILGNYDSSSSGAIHNSSHMVQALASSAEATSVTTFNTQYSDTGLFGLYATCGQYGQNQMMHEITTSLTQMCYEVDDERLAEAKNSLAFNMMNQLDGSTAVCEDIGRQMLTFGRRMHPTEVLARIEAVDKQAVLNVANRYFYDTDHALAAIGPIYELPDYNWIRRKSYYLRG